VAVKAHFGGSTSMQGASMDKLYPS
jgi:hypothetical protein